MLHCIRAAPLQNYSMAAALNYAIKINKICIRPIHGKIESMNVCVLFDEYVCVCVYSTQSNVWHNINWRQIKNKMWWVCCWNSGKMLPFRLSIARRIHSFIQCETQFRNKKMQQKKVKMLLHCVVQVYCNGIWFDIIVMDDDAFVMHFRFSSLK